MTDILLTSGITWPVPPDWNPADNNIDAIGGGAGSGGGGPDDQDDAGGGGGGGGGEFRSIANQPASGTITIQIGAPGAAGADGRGAPRPRPKPWTRIFHEGAGAGNAGGCPPTDGAGFHEGAMCPVPFMRYPGGPRLAERGAARR